MPDSVCFYWDKTVSGWCKEFQVSVSGKMDKWEAHYNRFYAPIHGETAGTSHFKFGTHDGIFEHGFADRFGSSTSAGYYIAPDDPTVTIYDDDDDPTESTFDDPDMVNTRFGAVLLHLLLLLDLPPSSLSLPFSLPPPASCVHTHTHVLSEY